MITTMTDERFRPRTSVFIPKDWHAIATSARISNTGNLIADAGVGGFVVVVLLVYAVS